MYCLRSSSTVRNIHISNGNGSFSFYLDCFLLSSSTDKTVIGLVYMSNPAGVFYEAGTGYPLHRRIKHSVLNLITVFIISIYLKNKSKYKHVT